MNFLHVAILAAIIVGALAYPNIKPSLNLRGVDPRGIIEDAVNATIEAIKRTIKDPQTVVSANIDFPVGQLIEGSLRVVNLKVSGISEFVLADLVVDVPNTSADFTALFSSLRIKTLYTGHLAVPNEDIPINLKGSGSADILVNDVKFIGSAKANIINSPITVSDVKAIIALGSIQVTITGLDGGDADDAIFNDWVNNELIDYLDDNQEAVSSIVGPLLERIINSILESASA